MHDRRFGGHTTYQSQETHESLRYPRLWPFRGAYLVSKTMGLLDIVDLFR